MYCYASWLDRAIDENVIDTQHRKSRREGANRIGCPDQFAYIAQMPFKCEIWSRTAQTIEVAEQNKRRVTADCCAPLGIGE